MRFPELGDRTLRILAWCVFGFYVAIGVWAITWGWLARSIEVSDASWSGGGFWANLAFVLAVFPFPLTGILIVTRRPGTASAGCCSSSASAGGSRP